MILSPSLGRLGALLGCSEVCPRSVDHPRTSISVRVSPAPPRRLRLPDVKGTFSSKAVSLAIGLRVRSLAERFEIFSRRGIPLPLFNLRRQPPQRLSMI